MIFDNITISHIILLFAIYAFMGWIIEVFYRSITQREFINAGFLYGPFVPLYGFGAALLILVELFMNQWPLPAKIVAYGIILTLIEYVTGIILEKTFKLKLWDYSDNKFNFQGRVSLFFSVCWALLAAIFVTLIHPVVMYYVQPLQTSFIHLLAVTFLAYGITDFVFSIISITSFRKKIAYLYSEYFNLSNAEIENIFNSFKRLRTAFPNLSRYIDNNINAEIKNRVSSFVKSIPARIMPSAHGRRPVESEFYEIISDIYEHEEFLKLKQFYHHNSSIYEHVMKVSYFSYKACKVLNLDYQSAARGGLLHDFFLYDWRNHDVPDLPEDKFHGIEHPKISVANAEKHFTLNDIEKDIILKHMWPLTLVPPKYKESFIVSFADKYLASREFVNKFKETKIKIPKGKESDAHEPHKKHKKKHKTHRTK
ncbi:MAG: hypothetical protein JW925_00145 [Syntrophaceae bacterium]|nr:hypothetical protein [Syntrophaceae bacterium]